jgi:hypothetical protein
VLEALEARVTKPNAQLEAGQPYLRDLENRGSRTPRSPCERRGEIDSFDSEVLAEQRGLDVEPFVCSPMA